MNTNIKTWHLFRHGLATHSKEGYGDNIMTASILPESVPIIQRMGKYLSEVSDSVNFVSPYPRCRQTAAIVTEITGKKFQVDAQLAEYHQTTFTDFHKRVSDFVTSIIDVSLTDIIVCTHGAVVAGIQSLLIKDEFLESDLLNYPECGEIVIIKDKEVKTLDYNHG